MMITSDIHVHTFLSSCAQKDALPASYLALCRENGIQTIGFADHFWDSGVEGASPWYAPQNLEHVLQIRSMLPPDSGVKVLFGVETEYTGGGRVGISPETAQNFDFVLIPPHHFHMKDYTIPASVTTPAEAKIWFLRHFMDVAVIELGVPTGIAHPFSPMGFQDGEAILRLITDGEYRDCFQTAAACGKSIELNPCYLHGPVAEYRRMLSIAAECGCFFHIGGDAHTPSSFLNNLKMGDVADRCGIQRSQILFEA